MSPPAAEPRTESLAETLRLLSEFVAEAQPGPWRRETGVAPSEEEHMVWLTNDAEDSLFVNADDVAMLVNAAIEAEAAAQPAPHNHDPDVCDECYEMVMESLRE